MLGYLLRRIGYSVIVVFGVLFLLYVRFLVTKPDDIARRALGDKATPAVIQQWKKNHGYDGRCIRCVAMSPTTCSSTISARMLTFDFGSQRFGRYSDSRPN